MITLYKTLVIILKNDVATLSHRLQKVLPLMNTLVQDKNLIPSRTTTNLTGYPGTIALKAKVTNSMG